MTENILARIDNGDLHTTPEYSTGKVPESDYEANHLRFRLLSQILDLIGDKLVTGDKDTSKEHPYYTNLRLTKEGKQQLRFESLTLEDIDNAYGKNSTKEWLAKPLILEACKYILLAILALIGGAYSDEIKSVFSSEQISEEKSETATNELPKTHNK